MRPNWCFSEENIYFSTLERVSTFFSHLRRESKFKFLCEALEQIFSILCLTFLFSSYEKSHYKE